MTDDHRHPGYEAALAQLARHIDELTDDIDRMLTAEQAARAEFRADINRLYAAWPEHMRYKH